MFVFLQTVACVCAASAAEPSPTTIDPHHVVGSEKCTKCHQSEMTTWHQTPHFQTFEQLHRKPKPMQSPNDLDSHRSSEMMFACSARARYTQQNTGSKNKVISGVSCESCHGASQASARVARRLRWTERHTRARNGGNISGNVVNRRSPKG